MSTRAQHKKWKSAVRVLNIIVIFTLAGAWYINLAPTYLGGPATYAIVDGVSMQPMFHTGDLVVAQTERSYAIGDLIVYANKSGYIIHRIIAGNSVGGWKTQGDHNTWVDSWVVREDQVLGKAQYSIPQIGSWFTWAAQHPLIFGSLFALLVLLQFVPRHRRHLDKTLIEALRSAHKDSKSGGRTGSDYFVLNATLFSSVITLGVVVFMYRMNLLFSSPGLVILSGFLLMAMFTYFYLHRIYDGWGVIEPNKSLLILSGMTYTLDLFPHLTGKSRATDSAIKLRAIAEKFRLPILHHFDSASRQHAFLVITEGHGNYFWIPQVLDQQHEMSGHSVDGAGSAFHLTKV